MCETNTVVPITQFDVERPPQKHTLTALVHKNMQKNYTEGTRRLQLIRSSMSLPDALCRRTKAFTTYTPNGEFHAWLQFYCQVALVEPGTRCPRKKCEVVMNVCSDQLLTFRYDSFPWIWRRPRSTHFLSPARKDNTGFFNEKDIVVIERLKYLSGTVMAFLISIHAPPGMQHIVFLAVFPAPPCSKNWKVAFTTLRL